ncbi:CLK4-associating serine/arginine rich protein [Anoplophora glabripennis]|nr:CLK4-associating serine/arginine rich protein [Anoplophora glabripennis]
MWHEARRQERKIRGMLVDYRRRAERRRDFYEKIKADPTQFLQVHGRQCKIHLDPNIAAAADSAVMMPWQGQADNLIDRFDVRAHLDYIPPLKKEQEIELSQEERQLNYERYRIIAQNSFLGISEEKFLKQLHLEEQFGYTEMKGKKEQRTGGAAIGFNYEDGTGISQTPIQDDEESDDNNSDSDLDVDLAINVSKMDSAQAHDMNKHGRNFGMSSNDFYSFLTNDLEEAETFRLAKEEEHEKALFSGRKSRRERRAHREKRLANRVISPPSYAAQASPTLPLFRDESRSKSRSRSASPDNTGKITYITSFGDDEETPSSSKPTYADKVKYGKSKNKKETSSERIVYYGRRGSRSRSRERNSGKRRRKSRSRSRRSRSRNTRSWSKSRRTKSRSKSRRRSRSKSRRSRSKSKDRRTRSHSKSNAAARSYRNRRSTSNSSSSTASSRRSKSRQKSLSPAKKKSPSIVKSPQCKSRSPSTAKESPPKVLPRYYGRRKSDHSSSDLSDSDQDDVDMKPVNNPVASDTKSGHGNNSGTAIKKTTSSSLTIIERLKRKRQALLNRQFKADKIAEQLKTEREKQEQQTREDELREMAIKLRRRQREKRHAYDSNRSSSSSDSDSSGKSKESVAEKSGSSREHSREREKEAKPLKRHESRYDNRERESRDRRGHSRERREGDRDNRRDKDRRSSSLSRRVVYREGDRDRRERWRDDRDRKDSRSSRALVDY